VPGELPGGELPGRIDAALPDIARLGAESRRPGGHVRTLSAGADPCRRRAVVAGDERAFEADDHVEDQVADRDEPHA
jgi:hypothetical protein